MAAVVIMYLPTMHAGASLLVRLVPTSPSPRQCAAAHIRQTVADIEATEGQVAA